MMTLGWRIVVRMASLRVPWRRRMVIAMNSSSSHKSGKTWGTPQWPLSGRDESISPQQVTYSTPTLGRKLAPLFRLPIHLISVFIWKQETVAVRGLNRCDRLLLSFYQVKLVKVNFGLDGVCVLLRYELTFSGKAFICRDEESKSFWFHFTLTSSRKLIQLLTNKNQPFVNLANEFTSSGTNMPYKCISLKTSLNEIPFTRTRRCLCELNTRTGSVFAASSMFAYRKKFRSWTLSRQFFGNFSLNGRHPFFAVQPVQLVPKRCHLIRPSRIFSPCLYISPTFHVKIENSIFDRHDGHGC